MFSANQCAFLSSFPHAFIPSRDARKVSSQIQIFYAEKENTDGDSILLAKTNVQTKEK